MPYAVTVTIYNEAGELVKGLYNGGAASQPYGVDIRAGASGLVFNVTGGGLTLSGLAWNLANDNGQMVSGGHLLCEGADHRPLRQGHRLHPGGGGPAAGAHQQPGYLQQRG